MSKRLEGRTAVILGASQRGGAGWTIAEVLAAEGAHVFVAARRLEKVQELADEIGGTAVQCDAVNEEQVRHFVETAAARTGTIDIAVPAVGVGTLGSIDETTLDKLQEGFAVNFFGPFQFVRHAARHMGKGGTVTMISSITSTHVMPGTVAYSCAKAAINAFIRYAAIEYAERGIRVNAIKAGVLEGPQARRWRRAGMFERFMQEIPLGAAIETTELAQLIIWLATEGHSITGETFHVDGGNHLRRSLFPEEYSEEGLASMGKRRPDAQTAQG